jgi:hypothetical protein
LIEPKQTEDQSKQLVSMLDWTKTNRRPTS